ncbi:hypothetical protein G6F50_016478 [Rhizopus delemar]|uniref:Uncharacterized protein n=1 Tax=Rhizopus delemar TaxID=936053 RepID=A0A9P6XSZ7_9FUNG|nr:hypothetical protein G6F50_016478 [Rhizopus delemar]
MAGHQVSDGRARALVGHMLGLQAGLLLQQFSGQLRGRSVAGRTERQFAGIGAGILQEFLQGLGGQGLRHHHQVVLFFDAGDGGQVLGRIERHVGVQAGIDDGGAGCGQQQRVAVGGGARHGLCADIAARARAVFHDQRLAQPTRQAPPA